MGDYILAIGSCVPLHQVGDDSFTINIEHLLNLFNRKKFIQPPQFEVFLLIGHILFEVDEL